MKKIKYWFENEAIAMYLAMQITILSIGLIFGLVVPSKRKAVAFIPAIIALIAGTVELGVYTLKKLPK